MPDLPLDFRVQLARDELAEHIRTKGPADFDDVTDIALRWSVCDWSLLPDVPDAMQVDFDEIHNALLAEIS